jgi:hypothetical protein
MANTAANVLVGKPATTGGVLTAPTGSTLPTDASTALDPAFVGVGYLSDDGLTQTINADTTEIKAWGGDVVRRVQTSHEVTYQFTMIETSDGSLKAYYGDSNVTTGTSTSIELKAGDMPHEVWDFEIADGSTKVRVVVPDGQVTDRGDIVYKDDSSIAYQVTLTAYPDASGVKAYIYKG